MADSVSAASLTFSRSCEIREAKGRGRGTFDEHKHPRDKDGKFASIMNRTAGALGGQHGLRGRYLAKRMINRLPAEQRMEATERYISQSNREMLGMFRGDRLLAINRGNSHSVGPGRHVLAYIKANRLTHNHPGGSGKDDYAWFSPPDINSVGRGKSLRVIDRRGNWQEMGNKTPKGFWNSLAQRGTIGKSADNVTHDFMGRLTGQEKQDLMASQLGGMAVGWGAGRVGQMAGRLAGAAIDNSYYMKGRKIPGAAAAVRDAAPWAGAYLAKKAATRAYDKYIEGPTTSRVIRDVVKRTGDAGGRKVGKMQRSFAQRQAAERRRVAADLKRSRIVRAIAARQAEAYGRVAGTVTSGDGRYDW